MNILIIGKDSYIGNHIDNWLTNYGWKVTQLDALTEDWKSFDYSPFDAIVHVAGIVHRPECKDWELYKQVNTDMPIYIATKAKQQGVSTYVYFSSMAVYGIGKSLRPNIVTKSSPLGTTSMYGKSKLLAEEGLSQLQDENFNVALVRPPSVYGKDCRGGYISGFASVVRALPIFPSAYKNVRQSFIYIDNLSELVRIIIENKLNGPFCPQDEVAVSANELLEAISIGMGKKYRSSRFLGLCAQLFSFTPIVRKVFGGIEYSREVSDIDSFNYVVVPFKEGMRRTVS